MNEQVTTRSPFSLEGKIALVTGAGQGIGKATAKQLWENGATVALADVALGNVNALAAELGERAAAFQIDVAIPEQCQHVVKQIEAQFGGIDVLINNAGICPRTAFRNATEADWDRQMNVNAKSQFFIMQAIQGIMKRRGGGKIVNLASIAGRIGTSADAIVYSATKGAVITLTKSLAREFAADNILVNCVAPGLIDTDILRQLPADRLQQIVGTIPLKRLGTAAEVASLILFLASDANSYCTGATFDINGGWMML